MVYNAGKSLYHATSVVYSAVKSIYHAMPVVNRAT